MIGRLMRFVRVALALALVTPVLAFLTAVVPAAPAQALDNGVALTPPMGFNDWNSFGCDIDAQDFYDMADLFVSSGLREAGYEYINIDDCWMDGRDLPRTDPARGTVGRSTTAPYRLLPDRDYFPDVDVDNSGAIEPDEEYNGIKALADYVHSLGLKLGIYSSAGTTTCQGLAGSLGYEEVDAETFADWGIDYLKLDTCGQHSTTTLDGRTVSYPDTVAGYEARYTAMRDALLDQDRDIVYSICDFTTNGQSWTWGSEVGNLWRTTTDIRASWSSVVSNFKETIELSEYAGPGAWNDPDMLEVGVDGALTPTENRSHLSLWAMMAAPLIIGADLREVTDDDMAVLLNEEVIAVDQDTLGEPATTVSHQDGLWVLSRPLDNGDVAVALFNETGSTKTIATTADAVGLDPADAYLLQDLWSGDETHTGGRISASVEGHATTMYRISTDPDAADASPHVTVSFDADTTSFSQGGTQDVDVVVSNDGTTGIQLGDVSLDVTSGWTAEEGALSGSTDIAGGESRTVTYQVTAPESDDDPITFGDLDASASWTDDVGPQDGGSSLHVTAVSPVRSPYRTVDTTGTSDAMFGQIGGTLDVAAAGSGVTAGVVFGTFSIPGNDEYGAIYKKDGAGEDATAEVTVSAVEGASSTNNRAGLMVRNNMAKEGTPVGIALYVTATHQVQLAYATDGGTGYTTTTTAATVPAGAITLKLERAGMAYTGYWSSDGGTTWTQVGAAAVTLPEAAAAPAQDVGVFHTSGSAGSSTEAKFQGFKVSSGYDPDAGWDASTSPYLGWSSWSMQATRAAGTNPNGSYSWLTQDAVKAQADYMAEHLKQYGYEYVNIDAGWWRTWNWTPVYDEHGRPTVWEERFPDMAGLVDYIHSLGLKVGIYMPAGMEAGDEGDNPDPIDLTQTIAGAPSCTLADALYPVDVTTGEPPRTNGWDSSYALDFEDTSDDCAQAYIDSVVDEFESWGGVDLLKVDGVSPGSGHTDISGANYRYDNRDDIAAYDKAFQATGHHVEIQVSWNISEAYVDDFAESSDSWRTQFDVECYCSSLTTWSTASGRLDSALQWAEHAGPDTGWNNLDSLIAGPNPLGGLTDDERRTIMGIWSIASSPLYLGDDLRDLDDFGLDLITNEDVLAVDQDPKANTLAEVGSGTDTRVVARQLENGDLVVGLFNLGSSAGSVTTTVSAAAEAAGLDFDPGAVKVTDLWSGETYQTTGKLSATLDSHDSTLLRVSADPDAASLAPSAVVSVTGGSGKLAPGATTTVSSTLTNTSAVAIDDLSLDLAAAGWTITPTGSLPASLDPGKSATVTFDAQAPAATKPVSFSSLVATGTFEANGHTRSATAAAAYAVAAPVQLPRQTANTTGTSAVFGELAGQLGISAAGSTVGATESSPFGTTPGGDDYGAIYEQDALTEHGSVTATVASQGGGSSAKAGIMVRNNMDGGGSLVGVALYVSNGRAAMVYNNTASGGSSYATRVGGGGFGAGTVTYPVRLKLERNGATYVGSYSTDNGNSWTQVGSVTANGQAKTQDAGVFQSAGSATTTSLAEFSALGVTTTAQPDTNPPSTNPPDATPGEPVRSKTTASIKSGKKVRFGRSFKVKVSVEAPGLTGGAVPAGKVSLFVRGVRVGRATMTNGRVVVKVTRNLSVGWHTIVVKYAGDDAVAKSSDKVTVQIVR